MDIVFNDVLTQSWKIAWYMVVPTLAIPLVSSVVAIVQGFLGIREDSVSYAIRLAVAIAVGLIMFPVISSSVVDLMLTALR